MPGDSGELPTADFRGLLLLLRGRAGLSQRALAGRLGVSERAVQAWEAGLSYPNAARLKALIALYQERGVFAPGHEYEAARALGSGACGCAPLSRRLRSGLVRLAAGQRPGCGTPR
jgi:transcriptional regulator with XRE-family HTH domain